MYRKKYIKYKMKYLDLYNKQKAGGCADIYCFICGGPTYSKEVITNTKLFKKHLKKKDKYYGVVPDGLWGSAEQVLSHLNFPENVHSKLSKSIKIPHNHKWLDNIIILTPIGIKTNMQSHGEMYVSCDGDEYSTPYFHKDSNNKYGHIMHKDCYKLLQKKYGKFEFNDVKLKEKYTNYPESINYGLIKKYHGQFFYQTLAYLEHPDVLESPLKNTKNKKRIEKIKIPIKILNTKDKKSKNLKKNRPSPSDSATLFKVGTIKIGNDKHKWIIKKVGKSQRWSKL